jgi:hypothetical protein
VKQKAENAKTSDLRQYCEMIARVIELYTCGKPMAQIFRQEFVTDQHLTLLNTRLSGQLENFEGDNSNADPALKNEKKRFLGAAIKAAKVEIERRGISGQALPMKGSTEDLNNAMMALSHMNQMRFIKTKKI